MTTGLVIAGLVALLAIVALWGLWRLAVAELSHADKRIETLDAEVEQLQEQLEEMGARLDDERRRHAEVVEAKDASLARYRELLSEHAGGDLLDEALRGSS